MIFLKKIKGKKGNTDNPNVKIKQDDGNQEISVRISKKQSDLFREQSMEKFYAKCRSFLIQNFPDFTKPLDDKSLNEFITKIISFGSKYDIKKEINIQKLMVIQIKYDFLKHYELPEDLNYILEYPDREEDKKVNYFHQQIIHAHG
ncbi:MAG: hypothetical protein DRJ05_02355 [Bacteroidetes bacterium]|nr:MAG: hypothetical protein DRJ05_02355 [Bacteroidota bacterium]